MYCSVNILIQTVSSTLKFNQFYSGPQPVCVCVCILPLRMGISFLFSGSIFQVCDHDSEIVCVMEVRRALLVA